MQSPEIAKRKSKMNRVPVSGGASVRDHESKPTQNKEFHMVKRNHEKTYSFAITSIVLLLKAYVKIKKVLKSIPMYRKNTPS